MKKLNPKQTFVVFVALMTGLLVAVVSLAARSIGRVEAVQMAADELEVRTVQIGAPIRAQLQRLHATVLRYQVSGSAGYRERFENYQQELDGFLDTNATFLDTEAERHLIAQLRQQLLGFYGSARKLMDTSAGESLASQLEEVNVGLEQCVDLSLQLGEARKATFHRSLATYRTATRRLERFILLSLVLLGIATCLLGWLAYRAYLAPLKGELAEARIRADRNERLASVGGLAAGIAHEIRNPLTAIKARLFALQELVGVNPAAIKQAVVIDGELNRMERLLKDFLDYARPSEPELETTDLRLILSETCALLAPELEAKNVALRLEAAEGMEVRVDRQQLKQVLLNLVKNACEASVDDGHAAVVVGAQRRGESVEISVQDNGPGVPQAYRSEIFTPFFSKKHGGTGLGLPICRSIVGKHGSELLFENSETAGTRFFFRLPAVALETAITNG